MAGKRSLNATKKQSSTDDKPGNSHGERKRGADRLDSPKTGNKTRSPKTRRRKRRFDPTEKLPTPPPDPTGERSPKRKSFREENKENQEEYFGPYLGTEDAFQHLEKLHSLVEQILELRDKNSRLFRRVRELERFKALRKLEASANLIGYIPPDEDVGFAESLLGAILESSASQRHQSSPAPSSPGFSDISRAKSFTAVPIVTRQRSRSIGTDGKPIVLPNSASKRSSCHLQYNGTAGQSCRTSKRNSLVGSSLGVAPPKVSKWTKVKAAFKWEKAGLGTGTGAALSSVVVEALEHDASAKFLRLPECGEAVTTSPSGSSPRTAEHSGPPSPGTLSSSSSTDEIYNGLHKRIHAARAIARETEEDPSRRSRSLDGELVIPQSIQYASQNLRDGGGRRLDKAIKTPWGMVKDIISSRRDNHVRRQLPRNSIRSDDGYSISSHESTDMINEIHVSESQSPSKPRVQVISPSDSSSLSVPSSTMMKPPSSPTGSSEIVDLASRRLTPTLTITVPSNEELRSVSSPESVSPQTSSQQHLDSNNSTDERSPSEDPDSSSKQYLQERRRSAGVSGGSPGGKPLQRHDSKWNKVKRAFLTSASSVPPSPSRTSSFFDETDAGGSYSASAEDLGNNSTAGGGAGGVSPTPQTSDIQRNYQILHEKLSSEFNRKLAEWEKLKSNGGTGARTATSPKDKDSANVLLMGEEQLTPEFKKKLQEWKRMKKGAGTVSPDNQVLRRRLTDWQLWKTSPAKSDQGKSSEVESVMGKAHLSEDFLKKMEEWKKIKSATRSDEEQSTGRRDSSELVQQTRSRRKVDEKWTFDDKEFQPLDKVIAMIEREQRRVDKHREKLDKDLRLDQLSRVVDSIPAKREVFVHTSTGFYRFEGISQEFTRKLYEWEKSQGIAPESSTFRLLNPSFRVYNKEKTVETAREKSQRTLKRSKSMSSIVDSSQNRDETAVRPPSSLSLNDVTNLENEAKLRIDSKVTIDEMSEELALDDSEPEAVIVDIEDVIEETASPMAKLQPEQTPVYCVTASETTSIAVPLGTVTASHEPSPVIFIQAGEDLHRAEKHHQQYSQLIDDGVQTSSSVETSSESGGNQQSKSHVISYDANNEDNRKRLFEPNEINICETIIEEEVASSQIGEESNLDPEVANLPKAQDRTKTTTTSATTVESSEKPSHKSEEPDPNAAKEESSPPSDTTSRNEVDQTNALHSNEPINDKNLIYRIILPRKSASPEDGDKETETNHEVPKNREPNNVPNELHRSAEANEAAVITVNPDVRQKRVLKTRRLTDTQVGYKWGQSSQTIEEKSPEVSDSLTVSTFPETPSVERIIINESTLNKIVVPTASNEQLNIGADSDPKKNDGRSNEDEPFARRLTSKSESKSVFVKTKRIIFSPFSRRNSKDKNAQKEEYQPEVPVVVPEVKAPEEPQPTQVSTLASVSLKPAKPSSSNSLSPKLPTIQKSRSSSECPSIFERRPPLPQSPILSRKEYRRSSPKETAPSIRMMIQRYNQKLQEDAGSPASSGSGSPIWRSPTSERRVRTQMEKYQEEVRRAIAGSSRYDAQKLEKSASAGVILQPARARNHLKSEILKSTSADFARSPNFKSKSGEQSEGDQKLDNGGESNNNNSNSENNNHGAASDKRRNSLQNKNPEIFSNIKQCLAQQFKTLPIKGDSRRTSKDEDSFDQDQDQDQDTPNRTEVSVESFPQDYSRFRGKISPELIHKLNALTNAAASSQGDGARYFDNHHLKFSTSENSTPLRIRAQRIKKAKDDFFSRGPGCHSHDPSVDRFSQDGDDSFVKSASAGMINAGFRTFGRRELDGTGSGSEPRSEKTSEIAGTLSKIASKFRRAKLKRAKDKDRESRMKTVSMLCRQSLLVDIQAEEMMSKSCPTSPSHHRDEEDHHHSRFKQHRDAC